MTGVVSTDGRNGLLAVSYNGISKVSSCDYIDVRSISGTRGIPLRIDKCSWKYETPRLIQ